MPRRRQIERPYDRCRRCDHFHRLHKTQADGWFDPGCAFGECPCKRYLPPKELHTGDGTVSWSQRSLLD